MVPLDNSQITIIVVMEMESVHDKLVNMNHMVQLSVWEAWTTPEPRYNQHSNTKILTLWRLTTTIVVVPHR